MNRDLWEGQWKRLKGEVQMQWALLTDDEPAFLEGSRVKLDGTLKKYHASWYSDTAGSGAH